MQVQCRVVFLAAVVLTLTKPLAAKSPISWQANVDAARRLSVQTNRPMLIHFWAEWCRPCQRMQKQVFSRPEVAQAIEQQFVPVKINVDHLPFTANQYGVSALPTDVVVAPDGKVLAKFVGAPDASRYLAQLRQVLPQSVAPSAPGGTQLAGPNRAAPRPTGYATQPVGGVATSVPSSVPTVGGLVQGATDRPPAVTGGPTGYENSQPAAANPWAPASAASPNQSASLAPSHLASAAGSYDPTVPAQSPSGPDLGIPFGGPPLMAMPMGGAVPNSGLAGYLASNNSADQFQPSLAPAIAATSQAESVLNAAATAGAQLPPGNPPLGLDGFCPVQLTDHQRWVPGNPQWGLIHANRTYLFAGAEERNRFDADPNRYAPVLSGCDVVLAVEQGRLIPGKRECGAWFEGRVYLFANDQTLQQFDRDPQRYITALGRFGSPAPNTAPGGSTPSLPNFNGAAVPAGAIRY